MDKEEMFELLKKEKLNPKYIGVDDSGFSRWIEFKTKYQKCWIEWYHNVSTLRVGDKWGIRIPFNEVDRQTTSPANISCLVFKNTQVKPNFGLADYKTELTLEKLDWQEKKS